MEVVASPEVTSHPQAPHLGSKFGCPEIHPQQSPAMEKTWPPEPEWRQREAHDLIPCGRPVPSFRLPTGLPCANMLNARARTCQVHSMSITGFMAGI